jgi:hypothetical protein
MEYILAPLLRASMSLSATLLSFAGISSPGLSSRSSSVTPAAASADLSDAMAALLNVAFASLWLYPIYGISFILNTIWYQDIATYALTSLKLANAGGGSGSGAASVGSGAQAQQQTLGPAGSNMSTVTPSGVGGESAVSRWLNSMAEEGYRLLLVAIFLCQALLLSYLPYVGGAIALCHSAWLYALYSFEYTWQELSWPLEKRIVFFERRWPYFLGFGLPAALLATVFPRFISLGVFALVFPLFILLAIVASPVPTSKELERYDRAVADTRAAGGDGTAALPRAPLGVVFRLPIFKYPKIINLALLRLLRARADRIKHQRAASSVGATVAQPAASAMK